MESLSFNDTLKSVEVRNTLESYYKWIINLSILILTISVSAVGLLKKPIYYSWLIIIGWVMLGICIFLNWLIVKRLVSFPFIEKQLETENNIKAKIMWSTMSNIKIYASIQNHLFLVGTILILLGFVLSSFKMTPSDIVISTVNPGWFSLVRIGLLYDIFGALVLVFTHVIVGSKRIREATLFWRDQIRIRNMIFTQMDTIFGLILICIGFILQILGQDSWMIVQFTNSKLHLPYVVPILLGASVMIYLIIRKPIRNIRIRRIDEQID